MIPFLNCDVAWIVLTIQSSEVPNSPSGPVSGWMKPITMGWVLAPAVDEDEDEDEDEAPLMLELQASSSPPPPTTAAPAPAARSTPRRVTPGDTPQTPPAHGRTVRPSVAA